MLQIFGAFKGSVTSPSDGLCCLLSSDDCVDKKPSDDVFLQKTKEQKSHNGEYETLLGANRNYLSSNHEHYRFNVFCTSFVSSTNDRDNSRRVCSYGSACSN